MQAATSTVCCALVMLLSGCALSVVDLTATMIGPPPVQAEFVPQRKPMVVLVIDPPDPTGAIGDAEPIATELERTIRDHNVAPIVESSRVSSLRSRSPVQYAMMTPAQIGRAVGAEQILRVAIMRSSLDSGASADMLKGQIAASVTLLDTGSGAVLFPTDGAAAATITYATPMLRIGDEVNAATVRQNMCTGLADRIAKLFYAHER